MLIKKKIAGIVFVVVLLVLIMTLNFFGLCWRQLRFVPEEEYTYRALQNEWKSLAEAAFSHNSTQKPQTLAQFLETNKVYVRVYQQITLRDLFSSDPLPYTPPQILRAIGIYRVAVFLAVETDTARGKYKWQATTFDSCCRPGDSTGEAMDKISSDWRRISSLSSIRY